MSGTRASILLLCALASVAGTLPASAAASPELVFIALPPCRVIDTSNGGGGAFTPGTVRTYILRGPTHSYASQGGSAGGCGIPDLDDTDHSQRFNIARALAVNITVKNPQTKGNFKAWAANGNEPAASVVNFNRITTADGTGMNIANGVIVPMCDAVAASPCGPGDLKFKSNLGTADLIVDVTGYFIAANQHLWGSGRPGTHRYGVVGDWCENDGRLIGLSFTLATWGTAQSACPYGTWVCSAVERGSDPCDTVRPDDGCDGYDCDGDCLNYSDFDHHGWTATFTGSFPRSISETGDYDVLDECTYLPVWCCS